MGVPNPFPTSYIFLTLFLPLIWLFGRALSNLVSRDRAVRSVLAVGLTVSVALLAVHITSLAFGDLRRGLPFGLLIAAVAGAATAVFARPILAMRPISGRGPSPWMYISGFAATLLMFPTTWNHHIHDELFTTGHMSIAAQMQNGIYPPRHLSFPDTPLRYHHGFDTLAASVSALLHLPIDRAIDVLTLFLFALSWCLFWVLGERFLGRSRAWLLPLLGLFCGGMPIVCDNDLPFLGHVLDACNLGKFYVNPSVSSYFFQHPWSLGIPVGLSALIVFTSRRTTQLVRAMVLVLSLAALSLSQITLFAAFLPSFLVVEFLTDTDESRVRRTARMVLTLGVALLFARLIGGFFTRSPGLIPMAFSLRVGFADTLRDTLLWNLQTFSILLPLAVLGFASMKRDRILFGLLVMGSLVVVNSVRYAGSNDINKFATLGLIAMSVLGAAALAPWFPARSESATRVSPWMTAVALGLAALICTSGFAYVGAIAASSTSMSLYIRLSPVQPNADDAAAIVWLRNHVGPSDVVYRASPQAWSYSQWGGLPTPWVQWPVRALGFSDEKIGRRIDLLEQKPSDPELWKRDGIRYLALDESFLDIEMRRLTDSWVNLGKAKIAYKTGHVRIVDLGPLPP
ncbi:MAG: hypothetical protein IPK82_33590 [Polyangiaceae bacterium]|nr:hypothetical protein [Polyangiaceae bacterium]